MEDHTKQQRSKKQWMQDKVRRDPQFAERMKEANREYARRHREKLKAERNCPLDANEIKVLVSNISADVDSLSAKVVSLLEQGQPTSVFNALVQKNRRIRSIYLGAIYYVASQPPDAVTSTQMIKSYDISLPTLLSVAKDIREVVQG